MRRTAALATCAALAITFAACGDDDDDAAGDSTPVTADAGDAGAAVSIRCESRHRMTSLNSPWTPQNTMSFALA